MRKWKKRERSFTPESLYKVALHIDIIIFLLILLSLERLRTVKNNLAWILYYKNMNGGRFSFANFNIDKITFTL